MQPVEILFEGLSQKTDEKLRASGRLDVIQNLEFDKDKALNKRRGYRRVPLSQTTHGVVFETVFSEITTFNGSLVLFGEEYIYSVVSVDGVVDGAAISQRGPSIRGSYRVRDIASSGVGDGYGS